MRKLLIAAVVGLAIAIAAPIVVFAVGGSTGSFVPENDVYATTVSAASTSSASWHDVAGLSVAPCSTASAAATASLVLSGAPVDLRMKANPSVMLPGAVRFAPAGGNHAFSFTWADSVVPGSGNTVAYKVQWKSPTGKLVKMTKGALNVLVESPSFCG